MTTGKTASPEEVHRIELDSFLPVFGLLLKMDELVSDDNSDNFNDIEALDLECQKWLGIGIIELRAQFLACQNLLLSRD